MIDDLIFSQTSDKSAPLKEPDAILHPKIESYIEEYINEDGDTNDLIDFLSNGYSGNLHKIDIIGSVMKNHGYNFQERFNSFIIKRIIQLFETSKFDQLVEYESAIPPWIYEMINNPAWSQTILSLAKKYTKSKFANFCFTKLCEAHPENVSSLQPVFHKFGQFQSVFQYYFTNFSAENKKRFLSIVTTDMRTLMYVALCLDRNSHVKLIQEIEILLNSKPPMLFFFQRTLMRLDQWDDDGIQAYFGKILLTPRHIALFNDYALYSNYSRSLAYRKLTSSLLDPNVDELTTNKILTSLSNLNDQSQDFQKCLKGVMVLKKWRFKSKDDIWYALNSCKEYFVASNVLIKIDSLMREKKVIVPESIASITDKEPVVEILKEIFYWQHSLRERVFTRFTRLFLIDNQSNSRFLNDLYDSLQFYFDNGMCINVLNILKRPDITMDVARERKFFMVLLPRLRAPYSDEFIKELSFTLDSKKVRLCFFPAPGKQASPSNISALKTLINFIEFANRQNACKGLSREASILDDLRSAASKVVNTIRRF